MPSPRSLIPTYLQARATDVSPETVQDSARYLETFVKFLEGRSLEEIAAVTEADLAEYAVELRTRLSRRRGRPLSDSFIASSLRSAKFFLVWARQAGFTLLDFSRFPIVRPLQKLKAVPSAEQVQKLLEAPDASCPEGFRDRLILECFYTLGLRRKECHRLDLADLELGAGTLKVMGKGSRERLLPLSPRLVELFKAYLRDGRPALRPSPEESALWVSPQSGRRLGYSTVKQRLDRFGDQVGLKVHPHLLRHACATHLLEGGADVESIAQLLGHKRTDSTSHYAQVKPAEMRSEHARCHPRASFEC